MRRVFWGAIAIGLVTAPASAQVQDLSLNGRLVFYGDNTEFSNPFRTGQTILGTSGALWIEAGLSERLTVRAGGFGDWRFGSSATVDRGRPVLALVVSDGRHQLILGTLDTARATRGAGPDRTGPHGLLPPMQRETLAFERGHEAGIQWTVDVPRYMQDAWVNWQRLNTRTDREVFDIGIATRTEVRPNLAVRGDFHIVHRGGQNGGTETVADSLAAAAGVEVGGPAGRLDRLSLELAALGSRHVPDREVSLATINGFGTFLRLATEDGPWRWHLILWRADDFVKSEGDPLYHATFKDGRRYRGIRDYAETGLSRRFTLAPNSFIEASARLHRTERHYEVSVRILGVASIRAPLR
jgi:hypothetical protein